MDRPRETFDTLKGGSEMTILKRMFVLMAALTGVMGLNAGFASAATQHTAAPVSVVHLTIPALLQSSQALGYCGPGISSKSQIVSYYVSHPGTAVETYIRSNPSYYHLQADQSFGTYLNSRHVKVFRAHKGYRIKSNTYCPTSTSIAPFFGHYDVGGVLMLWYCKDVRGYNCVPIAKGYCNNIVTGKPVRPVPKHLPKKPKKVVTPVKPKTPAGNCNANGSPGAIVCSTVTYVNVCGTQVAYNGDQDHLQSWINSYIADHCAPTVTTQVCAISGSLNYGMPGTCVPPPTCQFGGTFPNCSPPPCSVTNTCPPSQFTATGSTSVSSTKTAACPPPNSSVVKTGSASLASPTFTGHGNTQAAADQDLANQETNWRASNQAAVDAQAQNAANGQLSSCPSPPACKSSIVSVTTLNDLDAGGGSPNFHVQVSTCSGTTAKLLITARFGGFSPGQFDTSGLNTYTSTYAAPGEVPTGDASQNIPAGYDKITVKLLDSSGAVIDSDSQLVKINPPPPTH